MSETPAQSGSPPRPGPSLLEAVIPVAVLVALLAISVWLYGLDSSGGAIQVSLFTAATVAALMAARR